jgi:hypothetical protein
MKTWLTWLTSLVTAGKGARRRLASFKPGHQGYVWNGQQGSRGWRSFELIRGRSD